MFYKIKPTRFANGERFPVIIYDDGMPVFYPNAYLTSVLRASNKQYNTMMAASKAIQVLRAWEVKEKIVLSERMMAGQFLTLAELDRLLDAARAEYRWLKEQVNKIADQPTSSTKITSLAQFRRRKKTKKVEEQRAVGGGAFAGRIVYLVDYLKYLGEFAIYSKRDVLERNCIREELNAMLAILKRHAPDRFASTSSEEYQRLGLTYETEGVLREYIEPKYKMNPWHSKTQKRNRMIINMLLGLGIRGGELLNLRIGDFNFKNSSNDSTEGSNKTVTDPAKEDTVNILRLPDNPDDPRLYEPNVKTLPRPLKMKESLAIEIYDYITKIRSKQKGCRDHDFLVVSTINGAPLSRTAYNSIFAVVRKKVPGIPMNFDAHTCRYTWNDRFSDYCDENKVDHEREIKIRCKIMGWTPGSEMAEVYTRRSTQNAVNEHMLKQQEYLSNGRLRELVNGITTEDIEE